MLRVAASTICSPIPFETVVAGLLLLRHGVGAEMWFDDGPRSPFPGTLVQERLSFHRCVGRVHAIFVRCRPISHFTPCVSLGPPPFLTSGPQPGQQVHRICSTG